MNSRLVFGDCAELRSEKVDPRSCKDSYYIGLEHIEQKSLRLKGHGFGKDVDSQKQKFYKGDILFGKLRPYFRKIIIAPFDGICSTDIWVVKPKAGVDKNFLFYWMASEDFVASSTYASEGGRMPRAKWEWVSKFELYDFKFDEQVAIGRVLRVLDEKIEINNSISKTLEDIARSIFKSWFIDFDPVKAKMNDEKSIGMDDETAKLFPKSFEESELGPIPKGWLVNSLFGSGLEIESGSRPKGGVKGISIGIPSIGAESIHGLGVFEFSKTKYVPSDFFEKMNKGKPRDFDILLYKDGGKPGEFKPRVGMYGLGFPFKEFAINEHVFIIRSPELGQPYLYFWICFEKILDILRNRGIKAAIPGINQQDVGTLPTLMPSEKVLKAFNEMVTPYISLILTLSNQSLQLANIRDKLLSYLISGELQIPEEMLAS